MGGKFSFRFVHNFIAKLYKMWFIVSIVIVSFAVSTNAVRVQPCKIDKKQYQMEEGTVNLTDSNGVQCTEPPCPFKRKTMVTVELNFTPDVDMSSLKAAVSAKVFGVTVKSPELDGLNACEHLYTMPDVTKTNCPLKKGQAYKFKKDVFVKPSDPKLKTVLIWALKEKDAVAACFKLPVEVV